MVKVGKYYAEIINADGDVPFPEHTAPDGQIYVEVEPESEYWVRIKTDSEDLVLGHISVDGKSLGYHDPLSKTTPPMKNGLWEYKNGKSYNYALKFAKAKVREAANDGVSDRPYWTGKVEVEFYEPIFDGYYEQDDVSNTWTGGDVGFVLGISDPDKKKGVKSDQGSQFQVEKQSNRRCTSYKQGGTLCKITLRYCSTLGLIHANILPKPPLWDFHRLTNPAQSQENVPQPNSTIKGENGEKSEVFDLS